MKLVCLSDTHGRHHQIPNIPGGDVLIHTGDLTGFGRPSELEEFNAFLGTLPHQHKIVIAGNHDWYCQDYGQEVVQTIFTNAIYLQDSEVVIDGIKFYGSPWTIKFNNWFFMLPRGSEKLRKRWVAIPTDTSVLLTHGAPFGKLDVSMYRNEHTGCEFLREEVLNRIRPTYHIFGHIHSDYGMAMGEFTTFVNASTCNEAYQPVNPPIILEI